MAGLQNKTRTEFFSNQVNTQILRTGRPSNSFSIGLEKSLRSVEKSRREENPTVCLLSAKKENQYSIVKEQGKAGNGSAFFVYFLR
jgi:hypothetical protein